MTTQRIDYSTLILDELFPYECDRAFSRVATHEVAYVSGFNGAVYLYSQSDFDRQLCEAHASHHGTNPSFTQ